MLRTLEEKAKEWPLSDFAHPSIQPISSETLVRARHQVLLIERRQSVQENCALGVQGEEGPWGEERYTILEKMSWAILEDGEIARLLLSPKRCSKLSSPVK